MATLNIAHPAALPAPTSIPKRLIALHPLAAFFVIAYAGTWLCLLPMVLSADGLGLLAFRVPLPIYAVLFLISSFAGPTLAAFLVTDALEGAEGMHQLLRRYIQWRVGLAWYLVVVFGYPLIYIIALVIALGAAALRGLAAHPLTFFTQYLPALLIFPALITWGEEPGWRGFALTRMQARYHPLQSSLAVGLLHGLWHLPVFFLVAGPAAAGPFNAVAFLKMVAVGIVFSVIWTWVFNNAGQSILIAVLLHSSSNASLLWARSLVPTMPPAAGYISYGIFVLLALALVFATRTHLGYRSLVEAGAISNA